MGVVEISVIDELGDGAPVDTSAIDTEQRGDMLRARNASVSSSVTLILMLEYRGLLRFRHFE